MLQGDRRAADSYRQIPQRRPQVTALLAAALFMENLDRIIIVTALPKMTRSFGVTAYTLTPADVIFAATVAPDPIDAPCRPRSRRGHSGPATDRPLSGGLKQMRGRHPCGARVTRVV
jgi:hypothetical protein